MATPFKIAAIALAISVATSAAPLFGRDLQRMSVPSFSVAHNEGCVPGTGDFAKRPNVVSAGATVSVASMFVPQNVSHAYERAEKLLAKGKLDDAEAALEKTIAIYPSSAVAWCLMGTVHEEKLQIETAFADYSRAVLVDSRILPAYLGLARIAFRSKRWQDVVELTDKVLMMSANEFPVAYLYSAAANLQIGNYRKAEKSARIFQSLDTEHERPQVYLLLADILTGERDYAGAANEERMFLAIVRNPCGVPNGCDAESIRAEIKILEARTANK